MISARFSRREVVSDADRRWAAMFAAHGGRQNKTTKEPPHCERLREVHYLGSPSRKMQCRIVFPVACFVAVAIRGADLLQKLKRAASDGAPGFDDRRVGRHFDLGRHSAD